MCAGIATPVCLCLTTAWLWRYSSPAPNYMQTRPFTYTSMHTTHTSMHVHQTSHLHTSISGVSGNGFAFCFLLNPLTPFKCSFFSTLFFHFKFFKALTVNFSLIDHLLFFMCMQEPSSDTGFSPHRPEGFPNMLFFPLLRANMLTLFSAPSCSFFPHLSLFDLLQSSVLRLSHQNFLLAISSVRAKDQIPSHMFAGTETRTSLSLITCA